MGLFVKKEIALSKASYTISLNGRTKLVVGLGNIGKDYDGTRHNIGFAVVDKFAEQQGLIWRHAAKFKAEICEYDLDGKKIIFVKPATFMNESGQAVASIANFYKIEPKDILVIHDEVDVSFGEIRCKVGGGSAGHNGIKSVSTHIGEQYARLRIGVQNEHLTNTDTADFVLSKFSNKEQDALPKIVRETVNIMNEWLVAGKLSATEIKIGI